MQERLPEPSARPRQGKESPKMSRDGCRPQLTTLPDPPAALGRGIGVKRGLLQTSACKETGGLAGMVG